MKKLLLLPFLAALWAGACFDPLETCRYDYDKHQNVYSMSQTERDARFAVCAFALSCTGLILTSAFIKKDS